MRDAIEFGYIRGFDNLDKVRRAVFNEYGVECFGIGVSHQDTEFTYLFKTETRLNKSKVNEVKAFTKGVLSQWGGQLYAL